MSNKTAAPPAPVFSAPWWKAALLRALRTAVVIVIPYLGGATLVGLPWVTLGSAAALGFVASLLTSLAGLPELGTGSPTWLALTERTVKTFAQALVAGIGTHLLIQQVDWATIVQTAIIAAIGSLFVGVLGFLPETAVAARIAALPNESHEA